MLAASKATTDVCDRKTQGAVVVVERSQLLELALHLLKHANALFLLVPFEMGAYMADDEKMKSMANLISHDSCGRPPEDTDEDNGLLESKQIVSIPKSRLDSFFSFFTA